MSCAIVCNFNCLSSIWRVMQPLIRMMCVLACHPSPPPSRVNGLQFDNSICSLLPRLIAVFGWQIRRLAASWLPHGPAHRAAAAAAGSIFRRLPCRSAAILDSALHLEPSACYSNFASRILSGLLCFSEEIFAGFTLNYFWLKDLSIWETDEPFRDFLCSPAVLISHNGCLALGLSHLHPLLGKLVISPGNS